MGSSLLLVNYYYPNGKRSNERTGCVTIEKEALVMHLVERIKRDLDTDDRTSVQSSLSPNRKQSLSSIDHKS